MQFQKYIYSLLKSNPPIFDMNKHLLPANQTNDSLDNLWYHVYLQIDVAL